MGKCESVLAIDTTTKVCSISLLKADGTIISRESRSANTHAEMLNLMIQEVLATAELSFKELDAIAISKGPGSFTGLRIGYSTAQGLCAALSIPLYEVDTLGAMAQYVIQKNDQHPAYYIPMIDARRMEVYLSVFDEKTQLIHTPQPIIIPEQLPELNRDCPVFFFGDGAEKCISELPDSFTYVEGIYPNAAYLSAALAEGKSKLLYEKVLDIAYINPLYGKDYIAKKSTKHLI